MEELKGKVNLPPTLKLLSQPYRKGDQPLLPHLQGQEAHASGPVYPWAAPASLYPVSPTSPQLLPQPKRGLSPTQTATKNTLSPFSAEALAALDSDPKNPHQHPQPAAYGLTLTSPPLCTSPGSQGPSPSAAAHKPNIRLSQPCRTSVRPQLVTGSL